MDRLEPVQAWGYTQREGAVLVDLGNPADFASGHPQGAISLPFSEKGLAERLRTVLTAGIPVILLAATQEQEEAASAQLTDTFPLLGAVHGGRKGWQEASLPMDSLAEVPVQDLDSLISSQGVFVLDVREPMEWETGHVPGALLIPLGRLREHLRAILSQARVVVICEAGIRSSTAASVLRKEGFPKVANVPEGTAGYRRAGLPLQYPEERP